MNDFIGRKSAWREPEAGEHPNILQEFTRQHSSPDHYCVFKISDDLVDVIPA